ncbi:basic proline-rich protein-like [Canis lupus familiaris]|uniref:basic proline-rich protein-like n=1 Tax=Canis lupus familiaris TaxID=9615 RepID=UPI0018F68239|nr:basic proline-rich protein-like [Canis lupus familiaris]
MLHLPGAAGETGRWCALGGLERPRDPTSAGERRARAPAGLHLHCATAAFQPDSGKTRARRAGGRYRPHTVHGLGLDRKDLGPPRAAPGSGSSTHDPGDPVAACGARDLPKRGPRRRRQPPRPSSARALASLLFSRAGTASHVTPTSPAPPPAPPRPRRRPGPRPPRTAPHRTAPTNVRRHDRHRAMGRSPLPGGRVDRARRAAGGARRAAGAPARADAPPPPQEEDDDDTAGGPPPPRRTRPETRPRAPPCGATPATGERPAPEGERRAAEGRGAPEGQGDEPPPPPPRGRRVDDPAAAPGERARRRRRTPPGRDTVGGGRDGDVREREAGAGPVSPPTTRRRRRRHPPSLPLRAGARPTDARPAPPPPPRFHLHRASRRRARAPSFPLPLLTRPPSSPPDGHAHTRSLLSHVPRGQRAGTAPARPQPHGEGFAGEADGRKDGAPPPPPAAAFLR